MFCCHNKIKLVFFNTRQSDHHGMNEQHAPTGPTQKFQALPISKTIDMVFFCVDSVCKEKEKFMRTHIPLYL